MPIAASWTSACRQSVSPRHVYTSGDIALLIVDWFIAGMGRDGAPVHIEATATDVARRGPDGRAGGMSSTTSFVLDPESAGGKQRRVEAREAVLPEVRKVRIRRFAMADRIEARDLVVAQRPSRLRPRFVGQLRGIACADDDRRHGRSAQATSSARPAEPSVRSPRRSRSSSSTTSKSSESSTGGPASAVTCSLLRAGSGMPRRIRPVNRPHPSGLQTSAPTP